MFREVARKKQALSLAESIEVLKSAPRGVLSVVTEDGYPYGAPINHWYNEEDGKVYFHGGKKGHKIDALKQNNKVSFVCTDGGKPSEEGWWLVFRSVVVFGKVEFVEDEEKILEVARAISHKFTQDDGYIEDEIKQSGRATLVFAITPEHITGKIVTER